VIAEGFRDRAPEIGQASSFALESAVRCEANGSRLERETIGSQTSTRFTLRTGAALGVLFMLGVNELVEIALLSVCRLVLINELEIAFIELFEEVVPGDFAQVLVLVAGSFRKLETQDTWLFALVGTGNFGWNGMASFGPFPNLVVISGRLGECHEKNSFSLSNEMQRRENFCLRVTCDHDFFITLHDRALSV
jgi:hypothetical protein